VAMRKINILLTYAWFTWWSWDYTGENAVYELQVLHVKSPDGISRGDLPAFSRRIGMFGQASCLGVPEGRRVLKLRLGAIYCPGSRIEPN